MNYEVAWKVFMAVFEERRKSHDDGDFDDGDVDEIIDVAVRAATHD